MDIEGRPMLARQIDRLSRCDSIDELVIATSRDDRDEAIVTLGTQLGVRVVRGPEKDVLTRYVLAARATRADVVVRVTSDCPLIDAGVTDNVTNTLTDNAGSCDYASNVLRRTYPRGLDVEAMFVDTLFRLNGLARSTDDREHVTLAIRTSGSAFLTRSVEDDEDNSDMRWTVDETPDLEFVRTLYHDLELATREVSYRAIIQHVRDNPALRNINRHVNTWSPSSLSHVAETQGVE